MINSTTIITQTVQFNANVVFFNAQGAIGDCPAGKSTNIDLKLTDDHFLTGGDLRVKDATFGDFCNVQIVDVDFMLRGVLVPGAPYTYDQIPGYPVLRQFVTNWYLTDNETKQADFDLPYPAKVIAGLYIRLIYHSISTDLDAAPAKAAFNYHLHKALI